MGRRVADELIDTLVKAGIRRIYAVTGDSLNFVNNAVRRDGRIEWIHVRHEETGAFAALAEAQLTGIACCAGSSGPGHVHLINGLYDAHRSHCAVLAIASTCGTSEFGTAYFQETNTQKLFEDCSCYNQIATTPKQFTKMLQAALQHAVHLQDVAVIGLPGDVASESSASPETTAQLLPSRSVYRPVDEELNKLAGIIDKAEKITIYCGIGARGAHDQVVKLAGWINAPVAYSFKSKMSIQYDNPYEIGMTRLLGLPSAYGSMHESDLVLLLGTDFPYEQFMPEGCDIVQIDKRPELIGRRAKIKMGLAGDIADTLDALMPLIRKKEDRSFLNRQLKIYSRVNKRQDDLEEHKGGENTIAPEYVSSVIDKLAADDAIFTVDTGMCCVWGARFINATRNREMLGSFNHGSMANAMPMAIGASLAFPGRQIVAMCGDGGISMLLGDLSTIVQYKLPVKLFIFNNRALGMVKLEMEVAGLPDWQTDMKDPDFAAVAAAMGIKSASVRKPDDVQTAVKEALDYPSAYLLEIYTDPDALAMPPKVEFDQMKGFATAMTKLVLNGHSQEVIETAKSNMKYLKDIL